MLTVNSYFNDQVKSIAFQGDKLPATVGVISAGEYQFDTSKHETMTIISGTLLAQLPDTTEWLSYSAGESFEIAANTVFTVKTSADTVYLCTYA
jgi:purine/pyrimidine-nucleoside phosphorylase